ncbi:MAG: hypothetical protein V4702_05635 [Patescibacteria group bacterium]
MRKRLLLIANIVVIVILAGAAGFYFKKYRDLKAQNKQLSSQFETNTKELEAYKKDPSQASKAEVARIVGEVGKLYDLPKEEEPSVATVNDKEKLKDQPFFVKAENGDITLIYSKAKLALLYRPGSKQIINVSSVTIQDQPQPAPTTP